MGPRKNGEGGRAMIHPDERRKGVKQIQFSLEALQGAYLRPRGGTINNDTLFAQRPVSSYELNLSISQVILGLLSTVCVGSLVAWAFVKYWLFAP